jgi:hypothetical protein
VALSPRYPNVGGDLYFDTSCFDAYAHHYGIQFRMKAPIGFEFWVEIQRSGCAPFPGTMTVAVNTRRDLSWRFDDTERDYFLDFEDFMFVDNLGREKNSTAILQGLSYVAFKGISREVTIWPLYFRCKSW